MGEIELIITIVDRSRAERFVSLYQELGVHLVLCALGHGTASGEVLDYLGLSETEKAVFYTVTTGAQGRSLLRDVIYKMKIDIPGNGIVMTLPINSVGGSGAMRYLTDEDSVGEGDKSMEKDTAYDLIVVVTNQGYTDLVMDAARSAGASGGTVVHAKGTGMEQAKKFFGVSIAAEKEMIYIVAKRDAKKEIMKAVMNQAGLQSEARSVVFSLPVDSVAGLRVLEEETEA